MAAHFIRPREDWIDPRVPWDRTINGKGEFYVCPAFRGWPQIADAVVHYPGADWASMDFNRDGRVDIEDTKTILRAMHKDYLMGSRGYSLGYGFCVGVLGDIWEVRGTRNTNAANLGDRAHNHVGWNNWSISVIVIVDEADAATAEQVAAVNWLLDELAARKGASLNLKWHAVGQATACAGGGIIGQIKAGVIGFGKQKPVTPPETPIVIPPDSEDYLMAAAIAAIYVPGDAVRASVANPKWFALRADGGVRHAAGPDVVYADAVRAPRIPIDGIEHYNQLDVASQA